MGEGFSDFSAYEKRQLGWLPEPLRVSKPGTYRLARADLKSTLPRVLVVQTSAGDYWIERRSTGLMIRLVVPESAAPPFSAPAVLLMNPTNKRRPWIAAGETFRAQGLFTAKAAAQQRVRFTLLEQTTR
jgi:hypothetical protein